MTHTMSKRWLGLAVVLLLAGVALTPLDAQPPGPKGKGKGKGPASFGPFETLRGTVKEFTSAKKGETDGAMLDDGTWIHWPPHMADRFTEVVRKGDRVRVLGRWETGKKGDTKLEVSTVTNLRTGNAATNPDRPAPDDAGRATGTTDGSIEKRLRALEDRLDELTQELRRVRKKK
jgi:hypothetical protein